MSGIGFTFDPFGVFTDALRRRWDELQEQLSRQIDAGDADGARVTLDRMAPLAREASSRASLDECRIWVELLAGRLRDAERVHERFASGYSPSGLARAILRHLRVHTDDSLVELRAQVVEVPVSSLLARILVRFGHASDATAVYAPSGLPHETLHAVIEVLFHAQQYEGALALSGAAYTHYGLGVHAFNAACCLAKLGRPDEAIQRLEASRAAGYDIDFEDPDLASLRDRADFAALRQRAR